MKIEHKLIITKYQPGNNHHNMKIYEQYYKNIFSCTSEMIYHYLHPEADKEMYCYCGNKNTFKGLNKGYTKYCSNKCKNSSVEHNNKMRQTKLNNVDENGLNSYNRATLKSKQTKKLRYGNENYNNIEKSKQTMLNNIDENGLNAIQRRQLKIEQTNLEKYGVKCNWGSKDPKLNGSKTRLEKYGNICYFQSQECKDKIKDQYGVEYYFQTKEYKENFKNEQWIKNFQNKGIETKRENHTFNTSQPEEECYQLLLQKFGKENIIRQYKSKLYPFNCDFYIKSLDLYIECHFGWTHSPNKKGKPFKHSVEDIIDLQKLKSKNTKFYNNVIDTWTKRDPLKLQTFKKNKLNYKIFYSIEQFLNWYNNYLWNYNKKQILNICLKSQFPGTEKYEINHPIWDCNVVNKLSPKEAWKNKKLLKKAVDNLFYIVNKSINKNKDLQLIKRVYNALKQNNYLLICREILKRFTIVKIAPKVTSFQPSIFEKIIKESNIDISKGIYVPMAGFGGIIEGAKKYYQKYKINAEIEAYDINKNFCNYFGWKQRDILKQKIITDKIVIACPPFNNIEQWKGTPDNMYYDFHTWCKLIKEYIKASNYILIGPEIINSKHNKAGLFKKKYGIQLYKEYSL